MTFDSHSIQRLKDLGRQLPKELPRPNSNSNKKPTINRKLHPIETEQNPQALFKELINASPDGKVPIHLMNRLKEIEAKQTFPNTSQQPLPKSKQLKKEIEEDALYASFNQLLLEDEE